MIGCGQLSSFSQLEAFRLRSLCSESDAPCFEGKEPVLFIHGYALGGGLGRVGPDDESTFRRFPELIQALPSGYAAFAFEWSSSARFRDVASDLGAQIVRIAAKTGRKVHLVGHSMGGILARTLLQGLAGSDQSAARGLVRTLTTLSTPHSGIADSFKCLHGVGLPNGQDGLEMEFCEQLSCHELGEDVLDDTCEPSFFEVETVAGQWPGRLAATISSLPAIDILSLLGWTIESEPNKFAAGDELITYEGLRFLPSMTVSGTCPNVSTKTAETLLFFSPQGGATVTERALHANNPVPGALTGYGCKEKFWGDDWDPESCANADMGYAHSHSWIFRDAVLSVAAVDVNDTNHHAYRELKNWLANYPAGVAAGVGTLSVNVVARDSATSGLLAGVTVTVRDNTLAVVAEGITGPDGAVTIPVPYLPDESYGVHLSKAGYRSASVDFQLVGTPPPPVHLELGLWPLAKGDLAGRVTDASTGAGIPGVLYLLKNLDSLLDFRTFVTDAGGYYQCLGLPSGRYEVRFSKTGYETLTRTFVILPGGTTAGGVALTLIANPEEVTVSLPNLPAGAKPLVLKRIPAGTFQMGSPTNEQNSFAVEHPVHQVTLTKDYYIGKYEVTQAQWTAVMGTAPRCSGYGNGNDYPTCASWNDAAGPGGFIEKLKVLTGNTRFRLPTEAEWERAARAGTQTRFWFGDVLDGDNGCTASATANPFLWWCGNNSPNGAKPVGTKLANQFGLFDVNGNVWEWVNDWYGAGYYSVSPGSDPAGPSTGTTRVIRGGSWNFPLPYTRSAHRPADGPANVYADYGFRLSMSPVAVVTTCSSFTISPTSANPSSASGSQVVTLTGVPAGCTGGSWLTTGNGTWLTVSPASGTGPGDVTVSWLANPGEARPGTATIAGNTFSVNQAGTGAQEITVNLPGLPAGAKPLVLVRIPAGTFNMGAPVTELNSSAGERPVHQVTLSEYYVGKYEVTQAQWLAVTGTAPDCYGYGTGNDYPVYCVSWNEVAGSGGFIEKLRTLTGDARFRLPTEAEWERAARAGTQTRFSFGDALDSNDLCGASLAADPNLWWCRNTSNLSKPVGTKAANQFGLFDMHGNVWEWVQDWYGSYTSSAESNPTGPPTGSSRVYRGGSWSSNLYETRAAVHRGTLPNVHYTDTGFRLSRSQ